MTQNNRMKIIGITGGIGAGKSTVLHYLKNNFDCVTIILDDIGNDVKKKGKPAYRKLVQTLGVGILDEDGEIDRSKMASLIFKNQELVTVVNDIIHPEVKIETMRIIKESLEKGEARYLFIEAALLIESGYTELLDELWYISVPANERKTRLINDRGYSEERIDGIMANQLSDEEFARHADRVIVNSGSIDDIYEQIDNIMEEI